MRFNASTDTNDGREVSHLSDGIACLGCDTIVGEPYIEPYINPKTLNIDTK